jgi:HAD superfamily hydrolase (TIGR01549 family)
MSAPQGGRWVCLDVGETLVDETRVWTTWADVLAVPRFTFMALLGAAIARGDHQSAFRALGRADWRTVGPRVAEAYGGFGEADLYPDALPAIAALHAAGYRIAVIGNQPASRTAELRALGIAPEVMAMSDELGVAKPDPAFFARAIELMGDPDPADVAYVGDRVDNDVRPSDAAGMRAVWLRRGPWALIETGIPPEAALVVATLAELVERIPLAWATPAQGSRASEPPRSGATSLDDHGHGPAPALS